MKLLTLEILQSLQENENIKRDKDTIIVLNECVNEIIELERRYELINEALDERLKELEELQNRSCENCKFLDIDLICTNANTPCYSEYSGRYDNFGCSEWESK